MTTRTFHVLEPLTPSQVKGNKKSDPSDRRGRAYLKNEVFKATNVSESAIGL